MFFLSRVVCQSFIFLFFSALLWYFLLFWAVHLFVWLVTWFLFCFVLFVCIGKSRFYFFQIFFSCSRLLEFYYAVFILRAQLYFPVLSFLNFL